MFLNHSAAAQQAFRKMHNFYAVLQMSKSRPGKVIFLLPLPSVSPSRSDTLPLSECVSGAHMGLLNVNTALGAPDQRGFCFPLLAPTSPSPIFLPPSHTLRGTLTTWERPNHIPLPPPYTHTHTHTPWALFTWVPHPSSWRREGRLFQPMGPVSGLRAD